MKFHVDFARISIKNLEFRCHFDGLPEIFVHPFFFFQQGLSEADGEGDALVGGVVVFKVEGES